MPNAEVLAGRNLLTERPVPDKQFRSLKSMSGDLVRKPVFVALAYDTRHTDADGSPLLILADDANRRILFCNSTTMAVVGTTYEYPRQMDSSLTTVTSQTVNRCYGLAILNEPDDCLLAFLSEPQGIGIYPSDTSRTFIRYPILYYLRYDPLGATDPTVTMSSTRLKIEKWAVVDAGYMDSASAEYAYTQHGIEAKPVGSVDPAPVQFKTTPDEFGRGLSEYHNDLLTIGKWRGVQTIMTIDYYGQPLSHHPGTANTDRLCGVQYINGRTYTTMDRTADPDIAGRILAKFLTEQMDISRMIPLMSIEPFFLGPSPADVLKPDDDTTTETQYYGPDITIFQDRMAACFLDNVYIYRMAYIAFIVDGMPNDDIDIGSVLIGDYKIKKVVLKNIADVYKMRDVSLTVDDSQIDGATKPKLKEATKWVFLSKEDPVAAGDTTDIVDMAEQNASGSGLPSGTIWSQTIALATNPPYIEPDGEVAFWVAVGVPELYQSAPINGESVGVDDSPFVVPLLVRAKLG